jgi:hypothetical protein
MTLVKSEPKESFAQKTDFFRIFNCLKILSSQKRGGVKRGTIRFVLTSYTIADIF